MQALKFEDQHPLAVQVGNDLFTLLSSQELPVDDNRQGDVTIDAEWYFTHSFHYKSHVPGYYSIFLYPGAYYDGTNYQLLRQMLLEGRMQGTAWKTSTGVIYVQTERTSEHPYQMVFVLYPGEPLNHAVTKKLLWSQR